MDATTYKTSELLIELARLVAGGLHSPASISLPRIEGHTATLQLWGGDTAGIDAWAEHFGASAYSPEHVYTSPNGQRWLSYQVNTTVRGHKVHLWCQKLLPEDGK